MTKCDERDSYKGECCCNCSHQVRIFKHPWNKGFAEGSMLDLLGYGCMGIPGEVNMVIFSESQHCSCELWDSKEVIPPKQSNGQLHPEEAAE